MNEFVLELNADQLDGLVKLLFDLAKGSFAFVLFSTTSGSFLSKLFLGFLFTILGLAFIVLWYY